MFSKTDLSHAYQQVELDEDSQKYLTTNTHKGLYRYKRLPSVCRLDDFQISGGSPEEHLAILEEVFRRLQEHGIGLNIAK